MATYAELRDQFLNNSGLQDQVRVAITVAAIAIKDEDPGTTNHANRLIWAKQALNNPDEKVSAFMDVVLAENKTATVAAIESASDTTVQTNVDGAVDLFADGT